MKAPFPHAILAAVSLAVFVGACASPHVSGEAIDAKVASSVGMRFSDNAHSRPTGAATSILRDDGKVREHEYRWNNGCSYALLVDDLTDVILSWRYTSAPEPCLKISLHTFGT